MNLSRRETDARAAAGNLAVGVEPTKDQLRALLAALDAHLVANFATSTPDMRDEARDEGVVRFIQAASTSQVDPGSALAYLRTIVGHTMIDALRRTRVANRRLSAGAYAADDDNAIAAMVETEASAERVETMLHSLARSGDRVATRVVNAYLVIAERDGTSPSSRQVAAEAGVSHTAVAKVFGRIRENFGPGFPNDESRS